MGVGSTIGIGSIWVHRGHRVHYGYVYVLPCSTTILSVVDM